ncbi:unnamed protein product, partial [Hymenolepis diminuta]
RESSTSSSTRRNPNNKRALTQTRSSLDSRTTGDPRCRETTRKKLSKYYPHVLPELNDISLVSLLIWRQRRTGDEIHERDLFFNLRDLNVCKTNTGQSFRGY